MAHGLELRVPFVDMALLEKIGPASASKKPPNKLDLAKCVSSIPAEIVRREGMSITDIFAQQGEFVGVEKMEMQNLRDEPAHGRFARAHEADQSQIFDFPRVVHNGCLAEMRGIDTRLFSPGGTSYTSPTSTVKFGTRVTRPSESVLFSGQTEQVGENQIRQVAAVTAFKHAEHGHA